MTDRDRLAADLHTTMHLGNHATDTEYADRLIALGWGKNMTADDLAYATGREDGLAEALDEERLARALVAAMVAIGWDADAAGIWVRARLAHPAFKWAYREDTK